MAILLFVSYLVPCRVEGLVAAVNIIIVVVVVPRTPPLGENEDREEQQQGPMHHPFASDEEPISECA